MWVEQKPTGSKPILFPSVPCFFLGEILLNLPACFARARSIGWFFSLYEYPPPIAPWFAFILPSQVHACLLAFLHFYRTISSATIELVSSNSIHRYYYQSIGTRALLSNPFLRVTYLHYYNTHLTPFFSRQMHIPVSRNL